jgi:subtilisin family serine protease
VFSQERQSYYLRIAENTNLGNIQKTVNTDETLTLSTANVAFSSFLNSKNLYEFKQAFPGASTSSLQRVYKITMASTESHSDLLQRPEIQDLEILSNEQVLFENPLNTTNENATMSFTTSQSANYPNDYNELVFENLPNTALELMKARFAWKITKGSPGVFVGISDTPVDYSHEDLAGKEAGSILISGTVNSVNGHGTTVASIMAASTNNGKGIASIGYNTKIFSVGSSGFSYSELTEGVWLASQIPEVRVINCSFAGNYSTYYSAIHEEMYEDIARRGVLVVAGAGNNQDNTINLPASYDSTLSVTIVGSRYNLDVYHQNNDLWSRAWKDVHQNRPNTQPNSFLTHNEKVDVASPGNTVVTAKNNYNLFPSGYAYGNTSSAATPLVSGLAALVFAANPSLTGDEVKDIIKNTADDIYHISHNERFIDSLGTGRVNAFRAVKTAKCMDDFTPGLDLAMQNTAPDLFDEPDIVSEYFWESNDIWVRNQEDVDLIETHQNPEYKENGVNYVHVRVTNNSCETSSGTDPIKLYWAKANGALPWPSHWEDFSIPDPVTGQSVLMGDEIGVLDVPILEPGQSKVVVFPWQVPNPDDYININDNEWHFCLLARIDTPNDPMTFAEGIPIKPNVKNNNNIIWKNISVIDIIPGIVGAVGGVVAIGNTTDTQKAYTLELHPEKKEQGKALFQEAEISLEMDTVIYDAWLAGNEESTNFIDTKNPTLKIVNDSIALIENIILSANTIGTVHVSFNFLTKEQTNKRKFVYRLLQKVSSTNEIIGGETFEIRRNPRPIFTADAGANTEAEKNEPITISAAQINEAAIYNWYDPEGNLIHTGKDLTITTAITKKYKLEIISDIDGYKDYDEVEVTVNPYKLESIAPNPASNQVAINYDATGAGSAYLMVLDLTTGSSSNYILDTNQVISTLDISNYTIGQHSIVLVCDGEIQNAKTLVKQ